ncbi:Uncharacterised protein [Mycobacterium tuberculosis]|nr:Uncharacterised protein [Mycobacterium tuberculosis]COZ71611.1 Uncharacterised protein [Mycobacterium tuberculosis]
MTHHKIGQHTPVLQQRGQCHLDDKQRRLSKLCAFQ